MTTSGAHFGFNKAFILHVSFRCWFGKEPGKYIDYIYQGPVILVLLVSHSEPDHNTIIIIT